MAVDKPFVIAISGTRTIEDEEYVFRVLDEEATYYLLQGRDLEIRTGDARGVDKLARMWAKSRGFEPIVYCASLKMFNFLCENNILAIPSADWDIDGRQAGPMRNRAMLRGADLLVRVWDGSSPGTKDAGKAARSMGVFIHTWIWPEVERSAVQEYS